MNSEKYRRKLTAVLSADVVGYSRLMRDDEASTVDTITEYQEIISELIDQHRGRVVDFHGDNVLSEFVSVVDAVRCAVQIQEDLKGKNEGMPENRQMRFRIGINTGDVIQESDRIYGDGVNVAARIESLADPGGICISRSAYDQVEGKLNLRYENLGEHQVKNIDKPVRVYRVLMESGAEEILRKEKIREPASIERMAYPLPDKPSIAILPFANMSGDPSQDYIGDGLSENIIYTLSKIGGMFVIAQNSTFTYKGKPVKVQQVAEELGVQYVLEGSFQKSQNKLRITAQLIDALTGHHLWSERYDREMEDLFLLQDEITKKIVLSLHGELTRGEAIILESRTTDNLEAWSNVAKGFNFFFKSNREDNTRARSLFEKATKLDPNYASAWAWLGYTYFLDAVNVWSESPIYSMKLVNEYVQKALSLDDKDACALNLLASFYSVQREHEKAINIIEENIKLHPNFDGAYVTLSNTLFCAGRFEESVDAMKKAMRLSPNYPVLYLHFLGRNYLFMGKYEEAIEALKRVGDRSKKGEGPTWEALLFLAMLYVELGRENEARAFMKEVLENNPSLSLESTRMAHSFKNPSHLQRMLDAYQKAGMPEKAQMTAT